MYIKSFSGFTEFASRVDYLLAVVFAGLGLLFGGIWWWLLAAISLAAAVANPMEWLRKQFVHKSTPNRRR